MLAALSFALYEARVSELEDWREQLSNTTLLLAQQATNEMVAADLVLDGMIERIHSHHIDNPAAMRRTMSTKSEFRDLLARKKGLPQIDVATITDDEGRVVNFTRRFPAPPIDLADRDYFRVHREAARPGSFVSQPVRNRGNGEWTFYLSRRVSAPDGRFLGTVLVGLSSRRLSDFFSKINLGADSTVTLYRRDFTILARWPHVDTQMGVVNRTGSTYEIVGRRRRDDGVIVLDTPRLADNGMRTRRMGAARVVPNYPLIINVTVTENLFMRQWRTYAWQLAGMGLLCGLAILIVFRSLLREASRRERAMRRQQALKAKADAANRAKSDFLAMISHEIRTPLTSVIGFAEQLEHADGVQEAAELGGIIVRNGQILLSLINDILDMSKIEAGNLVIERIPFAPRETVAAMKMLMAGQVEQRGIRFDTNVVAGCPDRVLGDPTRWRQILLNLVSNAIKFTERGEVAVQVWYEPARERLVCRVSDTGIGMSAEQLTRLFKPFEQADKSIGRRFGGTGLGLYLVRQLADAMRGEVSVDSRPGEGTRITVAVHAAPAGICGSSEGTGGTREAERGGTYAGRVLLVEDSEDNRRLIKSMLTRMGVAVSCAEDGERGVALALAEAPDLVLMDIQMPVLDGLAAAGQLRARGFRGPIVALTANVTVQDRERYQAGGFDACVAKPIERSAFARMLGKFLQPASAPAPTPSDFNDLPEFAQMRHAFAGSLSARMSRMREGLARDDLGAAQIEAHTLKGSAASFGCPGVGAEAAKVEQACRTADLAAVHAALDALAAAMEKEAPGSLTTEGIS
jgi:hypothetical protein